MIFIFFPCIGIFLVEVMSIVKAKKNQKYQRKVWELSYLEVDGFLPLLFQILYCLTEVSWGKMHLGWLTNIYESRNSLNNASFLTNLATNETKATTLKTNLDDHNCNWHIVIFSSPALARLQQIWTENSFSEENWNKRILINEAFHLTSQSAS